MKRKTLFLIVSIFLMLTIAACGREYTCDCNCNTSIADNKEVEVILEPTPESTSKLEETEFEGNESYEEDEINEEKAKEVYNEAKELYQSGKWDGAPIILKSLTVSLGGSGDILVNDEQVYGSLSYVDLPDDFNCEEDVDSRCEYVPGQGVYAIKDKALIKYVRGKKVSLKGGVLDAKGSLNYLNNDDWEYNRTPYLYFDEESKELILITENPDSKTYYLYVVPDYDTSKVEYVTEVSDWSIHGHAACEALLFLPT